MWNVASCRRILDSLGIFSPHPARSGIFFDSVWVCVCGIVHVSPPTPSFPHDRFAWCGDGNIHTSLSTAGMFSSQALALEKEIVYRGYAADGHSLCVSPMSPLPVWMLRTYIHIEFQS